MTHEEAMRRAIELAERATGMVSPNPLVGCVILKDDHIIGEGWHQKYATAHAEVNAVRSAHESVTGATLVCTLEPCAHTGLTPPCVDLIIAKGISKVVIANVDPNPIVKGRGISALLSAGIQVEQGVLAEECSWMNRFFLKSIQSTVPYTILKSAQSLDGCVALANGESQWISCAQSRTVAHELRAAVDAVCVGLSTVVRDNPSLTVRHCEGPQPRRIILDTQLAIALGSTVVSDEYKHSTVVCCSDEASRSSKAEVIRQGGSKVIPAELDSSGRLELAGLLTLLKQQEGIHSIMFESGSELSSSLLKGSLLDEIQLFVAPIVIGNGMRIFSNVQTEQLTLAHRFHTRSTNILGTDVHIILRKQG